ncbi:MAG: glutathione S-transferase family protein [Cypionkella sp.]
MLTLVGTPKSRAFRPLWLLEELGLPYSHLPADPQSPEARDHNPTGKVPILIEDGLTLTDSTAILTYLADKHGQFTAKAGTPERAQQDSLTNFLLDELDAPLWVAARHSFVLPPEHRLPAIKDSLRFEFNQSLARLAARLRGPYLMGEAFTLPDIIATHCLRWGAAIKFAIPEPRLADYLARTTARPAFQRTAAL